MNRIYVAASDIQGHSVQLSEVDYHHIVHVLRMSMRDSLDLIVDEAFRYPVTITGFCGTLIEFDPISAPIPVPPSRCHITLIQGVAKGDKMETVIQMNTEMGVARFIPVMMERSIPKWDDRKARQLQERWAKIAVSAAKQSHQATVPSVWPPTRWTNVWEQTTETDLKLILWEGERATTLTQQIRTISPRSTPIRIAIIVGPEGGLSQKEVAQAIQMGFIPVTLGAHILRTEHAGFAAAAVIHALLEPLG